MRYASFNRMPEIARPVDLIVQACSNGHVEFYARNAQGLHVPLSTFTHEQLEAAAAAVRKLFAIAECEQAA